MAYICSLKLFVIPAEGTDDFLSEDFFCVFVPFSSSMSSSSSISSFYPFKALGDFFLQITFFFSSSFSSSISSYVSFSTSSFSSFLSDFSPTFALISSFFFSIFLAFKSSLIALAAARSFL